MLLDNMKREISLWVAVTLVLITASQSSSDGYIWTAKGCNVTYETLEPIPVSFKTEPETYYQICILRPGFPEKCLYYGMGDGSVMSVSIVVGEPPGEVVFVLKMDCAGEYDGEETDTGMCIKGECVVYLQESTISEDTSQSDYDPCKDVNCPITVCRGYDLWTQICVDGECVDFLLAEANSPQCGYDPCAGIECDNECEELDLWSQTCVDGECVPLYLIEANSPQCGYDPCTNHCDNGRQDCGEYGVDCGGGCPFSDSDHDNVEDCIDLCLNSRCDRVDANGCEIDSDGDGVLDCDDGCVYDIGDVSNQGCPDNNSFLFVGIGGAIALGGGLILWRRTGENPPGEDILEESCEKKRRQLKQVKERKKRAKEDLDQKKKNRENAEEKIKELRKKLKDMKKEIEKAEGEIEQARKHPDESSWIEEAGKPETRITSHDLLLRREASQIAWNDYKAGKITAQQCMGRWEEFNDTESLDRLREADESRREIRLERAEKAKEDAENTEENLRNELEKAEKELQEASNEEKAAKDILEKTEIEEKELEKKLEECEKKAEDCIEEFKDLKEKIEDLDSKYKKCREECLSFPKEYEDELSNCKQLLQRWWYSFKELREMIKSIMNLKKFTRAKIPEFEGLWNWGGPVGPMVGHAAEAIVRAPIPTDTISAVGGLYTIFAAILNPNTIAGQNRILKYNDNDWGELDRIQKAFNNFDKVLVKASQTCNKYLDGMEELGKKAKELKGCIESLPEPESLEIAVPKTLRECEIAKQRLNQLITKMEELLEKCKNCKSDEVRSDLKALNKAMESSIQKMNSTTEGLDKYKYYMGKLKCFISTAVYGDPLSYELNILREFRDSVMLTNKVGSKLVSYYYAIGPEIAEKIEDDEASKAFLRRFIGSSLFFIKKGQKRNGVQAEICHSLACIMYVLGTLTAKVITVRKSNFNKK